MKGTVLSSMYNDYQQQEYAYQQEQASHTNNTTDSQAHPPYWRHAYSKEETFPSTLPHNDVRVVAALTYSLGWFSGLMFALFNRQSRYVRFHALQSLIFFGGINLIDMGSLFVSHFAIMRYVPFLHNFVFFLFLFIMLLNVVGFIGWIMGITQAYRGSYYRLPVVGDIVAGMLGLGTHVKP
jgi:uncharacterized membrane protein